MCDNQVEGDEVSNYSPSNGEENINCDGQGYEDNIVQDEGNNESLERVRNEEKNVQGIKIL